jgi:hypothetical protein
MNEQIKHFDEMSCFLYLDGQLDAPLAQELRTHAAACESCGALLRALAAESLGLAHALTEADEALPARLASLERSSEARWAWLLGFGLSGAAAYAVWEGAILPWWDSISQAGFGGSTMLTALFFSGAFWKGWSPMIDTVQTGALVALGILAIWLVPLRLRRGAGVAAILGAVALLAGFPAPAGAAEIHKAQSYTLEKNQVIHDDLIVTGPTIEIDGTVDGDLIVVGRDVTVHGHVTGDIISLVQDLRVDGIVDDNIRGVVGTLTLDGSVGKNVSMVTQNLDLGSDAKIGGSLTTMSGDALLDGQLGRGLTGLTKHTEIEGSIGGETILYGDHLSIDSTAVLNGPVTFKGAEPPDVADGAHLASPVHFELRETRHRPPPTILFIGALLRYGAALLIGLLLMSILPGFFDAGLREVRRWSLALGVGALTTIVWIFLMIAAILLVLVGVGAGVAAAAIYLPLAYLAQIFVGSWLGEQIMPIETPSAGAHFGRLALGLLIIYAVGMIPFVGVLSWAVVFQWGIGATLLAVHTLARRPAVTAVA